MRAGQLCPALHSDSGTAFVQTLALCPIQADRAADAVKVRFHGQMRARVRVVGMSCVHLQRRMGGSDAVGRLLNGLLVLAAADALPLEVVEFVAVPHGLQFRAGE